MSGFFDGREGKQSDEIGEGWDLQICQIFNQKFIQGKIRVLSKCVRIGKSQKYLFIRYDSTMQAST